MLFIHECLHSCARSYIIHDGSPSRGPLQNEKHHCDCYETIESLTIIKNFFFQRENKKNSSAREKSRT